jgi:hypothetical protein
VNREMSGGEAGSAHLHSLTDRCLAEDDVGKEVQLGPQLHVQGLARGAATRGGQHALEAHAVTPHGLDGVGKALLGIGVLATVACRGEYGWGRDEV